MCVVMFSDGVPGTIKSIICKNGEKKQSAMSVPVRLKPTWINAVRLAFVDALIEDIIASIVEPMLLPKMIAALNCQLNVLFAAIVSTIAVMAEEE